MAGVVTVAHERQPDHELRDNSIKGQGLRREDINNPPNESAKQSVRVRQPDSKAMLGGDFLPPGR